MATTTCGRAELPGAGLSATSSTGCGSLISSNWTARRLAWRLHAFCLMTTHYHLVVETPAPNLACGMQYLNGVYAQAFNLRWGRFGPLWAGRYSSRLIEDDRYYAELCRYVLENPVRAGLCGTLGEWPWSGGIHRDALVPAPRRGQTLGHGRRPELRPRRRPEARPRPRPAPAGELDAEGESESRPQLASRQPRTRSPDGS